MAHSRGNPIDVGFDDALNSLDEMTAAPGTVELSDDVNAAMKVLAKTSPADMLGKSGLYDIMRRQQPGVDVLLKDADTLRTLNSDAKNAPQIAESGITGYEGRILVNLDTKVGFLKCLSNPQHESLSIDTKETKKLKPRSRRAQGQVTEPRLDLLSRTNRSVLSSSEKAEDIISDETMISSQDKTEDDIQVQINMEEQMFTDEDVKELREMMLDDEEKAKKDAQVSSSPIEASLILGQNKDDTTDIPLSTNSSSIQGDGQ